MEGELGSSKSLAMADGAQSFPAFRRTANYHPSLWDDTYIQSLPDSSMDASQIDLWRKLKEEARHFIDPDKQMDIIELLEYIDVLRQLGISYHFESEIKNVLGFITSSLESLSNILTNNLHGSALLFRLLREYGIKALSENFLVASFKNESGSFKVNILNDVKGMLSLYEASYLANEDEDLDKAMEFTTKHLSNYLKEPLLTNPPLLEQISHALELPLHWRMPRMHTRWFIDAYERQENMNPCLLEFAKLDFNMLQSIYKKELKELSRWKIIEIQRLPNYMKITLMTLFNTMNDISYAFIAEKGLDILPQLKRLWGDQCKGYLVEAIWYNKKNTPTLNEYMENAWLTIGGPLLITSAYCLSEDLTAETLNMLQFHPKATLYSSIISRLYDDLGTSTDELQRGDVQKSIQCHMNEANISESEARDYIRHLIKKYWKLLNSEYIINFNLEESFKQYVLNFPRATQFIYQNGDGFGKPDKETKDKIISLLIKPVPI